MMNFDVVIVLANQMDINGVLNNESKARAVKAVEIFNDNSSNFIVTCGWDYRKDTKIKIADALKRYLIEGLGVKADIVITELNSRDTVGDAYFTKTNFAKPFGWKNVCVVTSNYHVLRAKEIFNFIYGPCFDITVYGADVEVDNSILSNELSSMKAFKKTFFGISVGDDDSILSAICQHHPFYNGTIYKKYEV